MAKPRPLKPSSELTAFPSGVGHRTIRVGIRRAAYAPHLTALLACLFILTGLAVFELSLNAQVPAPGVFLARSVSGQFLIQSARPSFGSPLTVMLENDTNFVRMDPRLLTVSCERIKQLVWRSLEEPPSWTGKIFLKLYPANSADDPITIESEHFRDGWQYGVSLPNICHRERFVRALVRVVLLEIANRRAESRCAEVPAWLDEGLSREIWESNQREVILPPPQFSDSGLRITALLINAQKYAPLDHAHQELSSEPGLNFQQLSWPVPDSRTGDLGEIFRASSQLFVHRLLDLPNGPKHLRLMLGILPRYYNWQFAFLEAFQEDFKQPLDIEKWWSLQLIHFTGRELADTWTLEQSWRKLDESVRSAVQIRVGTNELPLHAEVLLQTIIREWPANRQSIALQTKIGELQMLRGRLDPALVPLVSAYVSTLEAYLQGLQHKAFVLPFQKHSTSRRTAAETLQHLDQLDAERARLQPESKSKLPIQAAARTIGR